MTLTYTTIRILRSRITMLMHEMGILRRENAALRAELAAAGITPRI